MNKNKCPKCELVNFGDSENCKRCGNRLLVPLTQAFFDNEYAGNPSHGGAGAIARKAPNRTVRESLWENSGFRQIAFGLLCIAGGAALTHYTHNIFYGAIIFGVAAALKGVIGLFTETD